MRAVARNIGVVFLLGCIVILLLMSFVPSEPNPESGCISYNEMLPPGFTFESKPGMICDATNMGGNVVHVSCCPRR